MKDAVYKSIELTGRPVTSPGNIAKGKMHPGQVTIKGGFLVNAQAEPAKHQKNIA